MMAYLIRSASWAASTAAEPVLMVAMVWLPIRMFRSTIWSGCSSGDRR